MERKCAPVVAAGQSELSVKRLAVYSYTHARDLKRYVKYRIIKQYVAVEFPVVVVGASAVVSAAGIEHSAYLHKTNRAVCSRIFVLALFRSKQRIHILKLLRRNKAYFIRQRICLERFPKCREIVCHVLFGVLEHSVYLFHRLFERFNVSVGSQNNLFPVPLVNVQRMKRVGLLVAAYSVHIGVKSFSYGKAVFAERISFPLCKRLHYLNVSARLFDVEFNRTFSAVKRVVETGFGRYEKRRRNSCKVERCGKLAFKIVLAEFYRYLRVLYAEN